MQGCYVGGQGLDMGRRTANEISLYEKVTRMPEVQYAVQVDKHNIPVYA
jgi:hypothetical protein